LLRLAQLRGYGLIVLAGDLDRMGKLLSVSKKEIFITLTLHLLLRLRIFLISGRKDANVGQG
jgi:hypothetical protein